MELNKYKTFEYQEKMRAYLSNDLSSTERAAFEEELQQAAELKEELAFNKQLHFITTQQDLFEVKDILEKIGKDPIQTRKLKGKRWPLSRFYWGVLFLFLLMLGGFSWWSNQSYQQKLKEQQNLINTYLTPLEDVIRSGNATSITLKRGMKYYADKDYPNAIIALKKQYDGSNDSNAGLYLAISYLLEDQAEESLNILDEIIPTLEDPILETALWYHALANAAQGDVAKAKKTIEAIAKNGVLYQASARELQKVLQR